MSKTEKERTLTTPHHGCCCSGVSRRQILRWGLLGAGAWMLQPVAQAGAAIASDGHAAKGLAGAEGALRTIVLRHAKRPDDLWAMMHGVRAIGKTFTVDGGSAVDYLSQHALQERVEQDRRYVVTSIKTEGHANTLLKTFLEAGVGLDYPMTVAGRRRRVSDLLEDARQLFTYEPGKINGSADELAWSIIAFAITTEPGRDQWHNAQRQQIRLRDVVKYAFDTVEWACADFRKAMREGRTPAWKDRISNFTCGGTHLLYSLGVAVRHRHLGEEGRERYAREIALLIWRLRIDLHLLDEYYKTVAKAYPGKDANWRPYQIDSRLKFLGHAFEILTYNRHYRLVPLTSDQEREVQWAGERLTEMIRELQGLNLGKIGEANMKLFDHLVGDACHAYHGIHMVVGENQV